MGTSASSSRVGKRSMVEIGSSVAWPGLMPGHQAGVRRCAVRCGGIRLVKYDPAFCQPVEVGGMDILVARKTGVVPAHVIDQDQGEVGRGGFWIAGCCCWLNSRQQVARIRWRGARRAPGRRGLRPSGGGAKQAGHFLKRFNSPDFTLLPQRIFLPHHPARAGLFVRGNRCGRARFHSLRGCAASSAPTAWHR